MSHSRIGAPDPDFLTQVTILMRMSWSPLASLVVPRQVQRWFAHQRIDCSTLRISRARTPTRPFQTTTIMKSTGGSYLAFFIGSKQSFRVDRPMNYRKPFTRIPDNIQPISSIPNFKTLQNITYKSWPVQNKERYHWAINGIKHTTQKYCKGLKLAVAEIF